MVTYIIVAIVIVALSFGPVVYSKSTAQSSVSITWKNGRPGTQTLFVHLAGLNGDGVTQIANITDTFLDAGDLLAVHYEGSLKKDASKFDAKRVMLATEKEVASLARSIDYSDVVFIGTSMGAKLAYQIAPRLLEHHGIATKIIVIDPPLTRRNFQWPLNFLALVMRALLYIPLANLLIVVPPLSRWFMKMLVVPPEESNIETTLTAQERRALDDSIDQARLTKASFYRDQVVFIMKRMSSYQCAWVEGDVVYLRSQNDQDTVRLSAYDSWCRLLGFDPAYLVVNGAKHCAYGENPTPYRKWLPVAFDLLELK